MDVQTSDAEPIPIGQRIEAALDGLGKNPAWLSEKVGVSRSTITRILKGERNPTPETLQEIAPVLGMTLAQLAMGTDAAGRVKETQELVSRSHYEGAVRQVIEYERKANDLTVRLREMSDGLQREQARARRARDELEAMVEERDQARRDARHHEHDARRYREALEKAVTDVASLQQQVRELGAAVAVGRNTGRVAAILAGVAAIASVASYLNSEPSSNEQDEDEDQDDEDQGDENSTEADSE